MAHITELAQLEVSPSDPYEVHGDAAADVFFYAAPPSATDDVAVHMLATGDVAFLSGAPPVFVTGPHRVVSDAAAKVLRATVHLQEPLAATPETPCDRPALHTGLSDDFASDTDASEAAVSKARDDGLPSARATTAPTPFRQVRRHSESAAPDGHDGRDGRSLPPTREGQHHHGQRSSTPSMLVQSLPSTPGKKPSGRASVRQLRHSIPTGRSGSVTAWSDLGKEHQTGNASSAAYEGWMNAATTIVVDGGDAPTARDVQLVRDVQLEYVSTVRDLLRRTMLKADAAALDGIKSLKALPGKEDALRMDIVTSYGVWVEEAARQLFEAQEKDAYAVVLKARKTDALVPWCSGDCVRCCATRQAWDRHARVAGETLRRALCTVESAGRAAIEHHASSSLVDARAALQWAAVVDAAVAEQKAAVSEREAAKRAHIELEADRAFHHDMERLYLAAIAEENERFVASQRRVIDNDANLSDEALEARNKRTGHRQRVVLGDEERACRGALKQLEDAARLKVETATEAILVAHELRAGRRHLSTVEAERDELREYQSTRVAEDNDAAARALREQQTELEAELKEIKRMKKLGPPKTQPPCTRCGEVPQAKDIYAHRMDECTERPIGCPRCQVAVPWSKLQEHKQSECPNRLQQCPQCEQYYTAKFLETRHTPALCAALPWAHELAKDLAGPRKARGFTSTCTPPFVVTEPPAPTASSLAVANASVRLGGSAGPQAASELPVPGSARGETNDGTSAGAPSNIDASATASPNMASPLPPRVPSIPSVSERSDTSTPRALSLEASQAPALLVVEPTSVVPPVAIAKPETDAGKLQRSAPSSERTGGSPNRATSFIQRGDESDTSAPVSARPTGFRAEVVLLDAARLPAVKSSSISSHAGGSAADSTDTAPAADAAAATGTPTPSVSARDVEGQPKPVDSVATDGTAGDDSAAGPESPASLASFASMPAKTFREALEKRDAGPAPTPCLPQHVPLSHVRPDVVTGDAGTALQVLTVNGKKAASAKAVERAVAAAKPGTAIKIGASARDGGVRGAGDGTYIVGGRKAEGLEYWAAVVLAEEDNAARQQPPPPPRKPKGKKK